MALGLVSPGVLVREIDRTVGAVDASFSIVGGLAGPFSQGPVEDPVIITSEKELIDNFGKPSLEDNHYEYWYAASDFMSYGGSLSLVRCDGTELKTANAGVGAGSVSLKIKNFDDYQASYSAGTTWYLAAKNPGSWFNDIKVCVIDGGSDQTIGISTADLGSAGVQVGYGVSASIDAVVAGAGSTSRFQGHIKGIITGIKTDSSGSSSFDVKITERVSIAGVSTAIEYKENARTLSLKATDTVTIIDGSGVATGAYGASGFTPASVTDWYDQQTLGLSNSTVSWKNIADKPGTSEYARERSGKNDQMHIVVVDDKGSVTGVAGQILEKNLFLSKGKDTRDQNVVTYYKDYLALNSAYLYAGKSLGTAIDLTQGIYPASSGFDAGTYTEVGLSDGDFGQDVQGVTFNSIGSLNLDLVGGKDYSTASSETPASMIGGYETSLSNVTASYALFERDEFDIDFLIMGPGLATMEETQAKAIKLLDIANARKDCIACISPPRSAVVNRASIDDARDSVLEYFAPLSSTSYGVFDSGYKYTYDRFNNEFIYLPLNADIAGMMVRTELNVYPWYSPAGVQRGGVNNIVKLAYDPPQSHRDALYKNRVNPVISNKGGGFILFGDKTALGYNSAFDRINVRRLFLVLEKAIEAAANTQLFEFNDSITRSTFVNIVSPFLRDVQAKRGITDFLLVCDDSNNPPDVIDRNEFIADIYIKPARSINFIGLTFVATRTGVSFEEVVGTV